MDPIYLPLSEAAKVIYYGASCEKCNETREIDLAKMAQTLGADFPTSKLKFKLVCKRCGSREKKIVTLYRSASTSESMKAHWVASGE